ncbi:MAG: RNA 2',3'-cyclic phosphodiesterase [bacterium]
MSNIRAFIALNPPYQTKNFITVQLFNLKPNFNFSDIKWTETENYHLTFLFFKSIDQAQILSYFEKLQEYLKDLESQNLSICSTLGFFKNKDAIKVIYLKVEPEEFVQEIYQRIKKVFSFHKFEEKFVPHITIGRVKRNLSLDKVQILENYRIEPVIFKAQEISLFKSTLTPLGPIYDIIKTITLKNSTK